MSVPMEYLDISCIVIDDESSMRKTIRNMVGRIGFKSVFEAGTGKSAMEMVKMVPGIGLALCDINMPGMSGLEFFKAVKADKDLDRLRFVFVSADGDRRTVAWVAESGEEFVVKPFNMLSLEDKITNVLKKKFSTSKFEELRRSFKSNLQANDLAAAERDVSALVDGQKNAADNPAVLFCLGELAVRKGKPAEAVRHFKAAIERQPMYTRAHDALAKVHEGNGDVEAARLCYEAAHKLSPANPDRLIGLCHLYVKSGDAAKAEVMLKATIEENEKKGRDMAAASRVMAELSLMRGDHETALQILRDALAKKPDDTGVMDSLADALQKAGMAAEATEVYLKMIAISPTADAYHQLGKTHIAGGDKQKAAEAFEQAWLLNPSSSIITRDLKEIGADTKLRL